MADECFHSANLSERYKVNMRGNAEQLPMMPPGTKRELRRSRGFPITLGVMVILFVAAMLGRNHIRAHWWAYRLAGADDLSSQSYYLGALSAVGSSAQGAVERLAEDDAPHVRAMAVVILESSAQTGSVRILGRLLNDTNVDVRESAALALGFMQTEDARAVLRRAIEEGSAGAAAAVHAHGRTGGATARDLICDALAFHASPAVRAQAVETLADMITMEAADPARSGERGRGVRDPWLALVGALADDGTFDGPLAIEREVAGARAFAAAAQALGPAPPAGTPAEGPRTVGHLAAKQLSALSGDTLEPVTELSPRRQADLADQCHRAFLRRGDASRYPPLPRDAEKPASAPAGSSDTFQDQP